MANGAGIYAITNTVNGKIYIGSTSTGFRQRWSVHRACLGGGYHHNPHLQHSWDKYGKDTFEFDVLEHLHKQEELHLAEQFWMDIYREEGKTLYNYGLAARSPWLDRSQTEEHKRKISEARRRPYPAFINQYTGEIILAGVGLCAMCQEHGLNEQGMSMVRVGSRRSCGGWILLSEHWQPWLL